MGDLNPCITSHLNKSTVVQKPEFYENLPLSATSFLGEKDQTSCNPPALPIFWLVGHDSKSQWGVRALVK